MAKDEEKKTKTTKSDKTTKKTTSTKKSTTKKTTTKKTTTKKTTPKKKEETKKLEDTIRIRIDDDRVNDVDSLDTSFIEGRRREKVREDKKARENILKESKDYSGVFTVFKVIFSIVLLVGIMFLGSIVIKKTNIFEKKVSSPKEEKKEIKEKVKIEDNYLFVGDYYVDDMDFEDFLYPYVKVSNKDYTTSDLLENIEDDVYMYNPSDVFIELGINDLNNGVEESEIINNLENIITGIKSNRKYARIYIESLYPINIKEESESTLKEDIDNDVIKSFNKKLEKLSKSLDVNYIDMYSELSEDDLLKEKYTDDGIHLNEDGYKRVFKVINRIVDDEHEKE